MMAVKVFILNLRKNDSAAVQLMAVVVMALLVCTAVGAVVYALNGSSDRETAYTVTYDLNGGTGTVPTESDKAEGDTFTAALTTDIVPPEDKYFSEWNTASDGSGTSYDAGGTVTMPCSDLILYAIWNDIVIASGANGTWASGFSNGHKIVVDRDISEFRGVKVNGEELTLDEDYTAESGSTIITLLPSYLGGLAAGVNAIDIEFGDGVVTTTLTTIELANGPFADPEIAGGLRIGDMFLYDVVDVDADEALDILTVDDTMTATIIGESGSYYLIMMEFELIYAINGGSAGSDGFLVMIHKQTGELLFSSSAGTDSVEYGGGTIPLEKWEWSRGIPFAEGQYTETITISSDGTCMPYKVTLNTWSMGDVTKRIEISFVLSEQMLTSDKVGTGLVYTVEGTDGETEISAEMVFMYAADGYWDGTSVRIMLMHAMSAPGSPSYNENGLDLLFPRPAWANVRDVAIDWFDNGDWEPFGEDTIETIDGSKLCDVYKAVYGDNVKMMYIGQDNGVMYLLTEDEDDYSTELTLTGHITRADNYLFEDPIITGGLKIGGTLTYDVVGLEDDGTFDDVRAGDTMTATVIGESGSYYLMSMEFDLEFSAGGFSGGREGFVVMVHKQTGELLFSSSAGADSIEYGGGTIPLEKWEWSKGIPYDDGQYSETITVSSGSDGIPYKIVLSTWLFLDGEEGTLDISFALSEQTGQTVLPEERGTGRVYLMQGTNDLGGTSAEIVFLYLADGYWEGEDIKVVLISMTFSPGSAIYNEHGVSIFYAFPPSTSIEDAVMLWYTDPSWVLTGTETIGTIDGPILCDVYERDYGIYGQMIWYIGQENGTLYLMIDSGDDYYAEMVLTGLISA